MVSTDKKSKGPFAKLFKAKSMGFTLPAENNGTHLLVMFKVDRSVTDTVYSMHLVCCKICFCAGKNELKPRKSLKSGKIRRKYISRVYILVFT